MRLCECREKYGRIYTRLFPWFGGKDTPMWGNKEKEREGILSKSLHLNKDVNFQIYASM